MADWAGKIADEGGLPGCHGQSSKCDSMVRSGVFIWSLLHDICDLGRVVLPSKVTDMVIFSKECGYFT